MDKDKSIKVFIIVALAISLVIAVFLSPLASSFPDGLEKAAEELGFLEKGEIAVWGHSPMPDYGLTFLGESPLSGMLSGLIGTVAVFGLGWCVGLVLKKRKSV